MELFLPTILFLASTVLSGIFIPVAFMETAEKNPPLCLVTVVVILFSTGIGVLWNVWPANELALLFFAVIWMIPLVYGLVIVVLKLPEPEFFDKLGGLCILNLFTLTIWTVLILIDLADGRL